LKEVLEEMKIDLPDLEELFKPENSIGNSLEIIDEILEKLDAVNPHKGFKPL
jgi:3-carboxy-cis,cis-muconate cycloisomerase